MHVIYKFFPFLHTNTCYYFVQHLCSLVIPQNPPQILHIHQKMTNPFDGMLKSVWEKVGPIIEQMGNERRVDNGVSGLKDCYDILQNVNNQRMTFEQVATIEEVQAYYYSMLHETVSEHLEPARKKRKCASAAAQSEEEVLLVTTSTATESKPGEEVTEPHQVVTDSRP